MVSVVFALACHLQHFDSTTLSCLLQTSDRWLFLRAASVKPTPVLHGSSFWIGNQHVRHRWDGKVRYPSDTLGCEASSTSDRGPWNPASSMISLLNTTATVASVHQKNQKREKLIRVFCSNTKNVRFFCFLSSLTLASPSFRSLICSICLFIHYSPRGGNNSLSLFIILHPHLILPSFVNDTCHSFISIIISFSSVHDPRS